MGTRTGIPAQEIRQLKFESVRLETGSEFVEDTVFLFFILGGKGDAETNVSARLIPRYGRDQLLLDEPLGEGLAVGKRLGAGAGSGLRGTGVKKEGSRGFFRSETRAPQDLDEPIHAATVLSGGGLGDAGIFEGDGGGILHSHELARIGVVFDISVGRNEKGISGNKTTTPPGHIKGLARGVQFETDVLGTGKREEAERLTLKNQGGVGGIMNDDNFFLFGKSNHLLEEFGCGGGSGGIIGIVQDEDFGSVKDLARDGIEAGEELIFGREGQRVNDPTIVGGVGPKNWIARGGHEDDISGINQSRGKNGEGGFAPNGVHNFRFWVNGHSENFVHVMSGGGTEAGSPIIGVATIFGQGSFLGEAGDYFGIGHRVRFADPKIEEFSTGMSGEGSPLGPLNSLKLIDRGLLQTIARATDSLGEEVVKVGRHFVGWVRDEVYDKTGPNAKGLLWLAKEGSDDCVCSDDGSAAQSASSFD